MSKLKIREVFAYQRPYDQYPEIRGEYRNHFFVTHSPKSNMALLESGINPIAELKAVDGLRRPAILIRSSPHKIGSEDTPWQDVFDVDNGHIRYYGDNKIAGRDPATTDGNKALLQAYNSYYGDNNGRDASIPLLFYRSVTRNNKPKGFVEFNGFGIIKDIELITQFDRRQNCTFANFAYNFQVFSISKENEEFDWRWISARRNKELSLEATLRFAPASWIEWIKHGTKALERCRRRVSKLMTITTAEQIPLKGSREEKVLQAVYDYYHDKKARFEAVAAEVTAKVIRDDIGKYHEGWITPGTSDNGVDFYGRIDVGVGFGAAKLIVLGQAKCEKLTTPTGGTHIARTVARLRRGWLGVYVTTSFFSEPVQREIIEDEYPILLINGKRVAEVLIKIMHDEGFSTIKGLLDSIDKKYEKLVQNRRPDELFYE